MENISEIKPKRGRPSTLFSSEQHKAQFRQLWSAKSDRTLRNRHHFTVAMAVIDFGRDPEFLWLADSANDRQRMTVLTELGRIDGVDTIREVARKLCAEKPVTKDAIAWLRKFRQTQKPTKVKTIERQITSLVDDWLPKPGASLAGAREALRSVLSTVEFLIDAESNSGE